MESNLREIVEKIAQSEHIDEARMLANECLSVMDRIHNEYVEHQKSQKIKLAEIDKKQNREFSRIRFECASNLIEQWNGWGVNPEKGCKHLKKSGLGLLDDVPLTDDQCSQLVEKYGHPFEMIRKVFPVEQIQEETNTDKALSP